MSTPTRKIDAVDRSRQAVAGIVSVWNSQDLDALDDVVAEEYAKHHPGAPQGLAGLKDYMRGQFEQLSGLRVELEDLICERDRAVARLALTFTRDGAARHAQMIDIWRVADGKLAEYWSGDPTPTDPS